MKGCNGNSLNAKLRRVADYPPRLPKDASVKKMITYYKKQFKREEQTERMGLGRDCNIPHLRACEKHWRNISGKSASVPFIQANGSEKTQSYPIKPFSAQVYIGENSFMSPQKTKSRGNARDRATLRHLAGVCSNSFALSQQQVLEMNNVGVLAWSAYPKM